MILDFISSLSEAKAEALNALKAISDLKSYTLLEKSVLSKKGSLKMLLNQLKTFTPDQKREAGPQLQQVKAEIIQHFQQKKAELEQSAQNAALLKEKIDISAIEPPRFGAMHVVSEMQMQAEAIFERMGFLIADGPELETEWYNFDALNIPETHPARDMQDTFWVKSNTGNPKTNKVLRTQTSNVQIRAMQKHGAPLRMVCPGRVFRNEDIDATHDFVFYQLEGLVVDKNINLTHLKGTIKHFLAEILQKDVKLRFRPGFFPFVEPGLEVDLWFEYEKDGQKHGKWLEMMGAGMVHPNVLKNAGVDPEKYQGFAFGVGITRLVMLKHGIADIRQLFGAKGVR